MSNKTPIRVTGSFTPVGVQDVNIVSPIPLEITIQAAVSSVVTRVPSSTSNQMLLAANPIRLGVLLYNHGDAEQYVKLGTIATLTDFTVRLTPRMFYEVSSPIYLGQIDVISSSNNGAIQVTELS